MRSKQQSVGVQGMAALLALASGLGACGGVGPDDGEAFRFLADARVDVTIEGGVLATILRVQNQSDRADTLRYGGCQAGSVTTLHDPTSGAVVWTSAAPPGIPCAAILVELPVSAGRIEGIERQFRVQEILGDSIAPGFYRATVRPDFVGHTEPVIQVGTHDLRP